MGDKKIKGCHTCQKFIPSIDGCTGTCAYVLDLNAGLIEAQRTALPGYSPTLEWRKELGDGRGCWAYGYGIGDSPAAAFENYCKEVGIWE